MDDLDRAKELEMRQRQAALDAQTRRQAEADQQEQLIVDGVVVCIDCLEPIPEARLKARPCAVRCVECKQVKEKYSRGLG